MLQKVTKIYNNLMMLSFLFSPSPEPGESPGTETELETFSLGMERNFA
jgi:hypothetical protein